MKYKIEIHDDKLGVRIIKRLNDDFQQIIFTARPWVIWTRKGSWGKARPGRKERKESEVRVLAQVFTKTGPWDMIDTDGRHVGADVSVHDKTRFQPLQSFPPTKSYARETEPRCNEPDCEICHPEVRAELIAIENEVRERIKREDNEPVSHSEHDDGRLAQNELLHG